ncbi:hypothetical protein KFE98_15350 [bacterium SCSIO 12741]|nr:hypothetical protein KFE98_15350 [bacterium SCSIO 12741]
MKKSILLLVFAGLLLGSGIQAQSDFSLGDYSLDDSSQIKVGVWFENHFNSNVISNSMYYNQLFKTTLSRSSQESMKGRLFKRNRAGNQETERIYASYKGKNSTDSTGLTHFVTAGVRRSVVSGFGRDVFLLTALGNKQFAGTTADLDYLEVELMQYMQVQYGVIRQTPNWTYGAAVGFLMGNRYLDISSEKSGVYTSSIGDTLHGFAKGSIYSSDTNSRNIFDINGYGASIDLFLAKRLDLFKKHDGAGEIRFEVNDLGFISWNDRSVEYTVDGEYTWTGIDAPNLFDISDSLFNDQVPDDLEGKFVKERKGGSFTRMLNPRIAIYHIEQLNDRVLLKNMIDYRFNAHQLPYIASSQFVRINKDPGAWNYTMNFYESVAGYGFVGLGLGFGIDHEKFNFLIGSRNLIAMMSPDYLSGSNVHFGFHWKFR